MFVAKQAWACLFGILFIVALILTALFWQDNWPIHRYDALLIFAVTTQASFLILKLESFKEARVILIFHVVGTVMEIFKLHMGSWDYPEPGLTKLGGVPLFSGFMYACVGSYIARVIRVFEMSFAPYPPFWITVALAAVIYGNFFTHHFAPDIRMALFAATIVIFIRTRIWFWIGDNAYWMPLPVAAFLASFFLWVAENVGTMTGTWAYKGHLGDCRDSQTWQLVPAALRLVPIGDTCLPRCLVPEPPRPQMIRLLALLLILAAPAQACRQALILALDVSSSVSQREYELQRDGLAGALLNDQIRDLIIGAPGNEVAIMVYEWGDYYYQRVLLDWTLITGDAALNKAAGTIAAVQRSGPTRATGIGGAMRFAIQEFRKVPTCTIRTLDISGDGKNNSGERPEFMHRDLEYNGITVNGLVVATRDIAEMSAYYHSSVIVGAAAFVETAGGFEDYGEAMQRKLLRELVPGFAAR